MGAKANTSRLVDENGVINKDGFYNYLTAWVNQDPMTYHVSQAAMSPKPPFYKFNIDMATVKNMTVPPAKNLLFSRIPFFSYGLVDTPTIVDMIQKTRSICEDFSEKGLPNFPDGLPFTFWEQYLDLRYNLIIALLMVIGSVFVVISILLINPWTSAVVFFWYRSYCFPFFIRCLLFTLRGFTFFRVRLVHSLITAVGIGVEFTVHISLSYLTSLGSRNERMASTLNHMFIPVLHGGLSTLLGVIMLAFSEFEFIVRYFFMVMSALIVLGIINGLVLLPVLLSIVGPNSE
uniref:Uncharacterized protein n=1 Tax=Romanomermis culicivorax TaxID=13658 RepID=A0A915HMS2_ROMCU